MKIASHILVASSLAACSFDSSAPNLGFADGAPGAADAARADAALFDATVPPEGGKHLLLTEVNTTGSGLEFIEIYNPTDVTIGLGDYYVSDTKSYAFLPGAFGAGPRPSVIMSDFIARFPQGASIDPGEVQVVAIKPQNFQDSFGAKALYAIGAEDQELEMQAAFPSSLGPLITLTDSGEAITLFYWDGASDLVVDIDIVNAGATTSSDNSIAIKTDTSLDGPDSGSSTSSYLKDQGTMGLMAIAALRQESYQRIAPETSHELHTGPGNGLFGHDETSEDIATTWAITAAPSPGVASGL